MSELILDSLEIKGFRAFEHLRIERLGRVNLIVGKNNVGKSCLLEALRLYAQRGALDVVLESLASRDESQALMGKSIKQEGFSHAVRNLFYGHEAFGAYSNVSRFSVGPCDEPSARFTFEVGWYVEQADEWGRWLQEVTNLSAKTFAARGESFLPGITLRWGNVAVTLELGHFLEEFLYDHPWSKRVQKIPTFFISANGLSAKILATLWDNIALKPEEERILDALHIISPEVERVNLLGQNSTQSERIPMARIRSFSDPMPLRSLGEGMSRLFGIVLALVNARDGFLLIDEVDSGLHYTVHSNLWRLIFQVAARLNVQVFATTHSWDCIEGFQQVAQETETVGGMLIRLEMRQGHSVPILFDEERLGIATRQDIEVR